MINFFEYKNKFEIELVEKGIEKEIFGQIKAINIRDSKLKYTYFGRVVGMSIPTYKIFAIDYYGYIKKTEGFRDSCPLTLQLLKGTQVKSIAAPLVHFSSIKMEDIVKINPDMIKYFPIFKSTLLKIRGFKE